MAMSCTKTFADKGLYSGPSFWAFTQTHFLRGFYFMFFFQT